MANPQVSEQAILDAVLFIRRDQRAAYLDKACGGDTELRRRVEALLQAREAQGEVPTAIATMSPAPPKELSPARLPAMEQIGNWIDRYKLLQQIGEGGCGTVYMAEQEQPVRRRVALKVIKLGMDTKQVIARFEAERQALALMDHPNIARVLDAGATESGRPFFVMELVRGERITDYCDKNNVSTRARLDLFVQVCRAIQHAHQKGIIHRDIKPSNILVTIHDGVPMPKVIDFGIAKATEQRLTDKTLFTALEQFIGTPAYMSPEQAEMTGLDIDTRSDIYSLGVVLYELLCGKTPFDAKELQSAGLDGMRRKIRETEPPRPSNRLTTMQEGELTTTAKRRHTEAPKLIHQLRGDLDWIVMKALEKDRTRRYETANGLAMDIERHLNNEPVLARPPSQAYRFQKLVRRNKLAFAAGGMVAAALIFGLGLSTWSFVREKAARARAVAAEQTQSRLRQAAETAEAAARTAAARSSEVAQFLEEMLSSIDPSVAQGQDTTLLRKILDRTVERLGKELKDQPGVEAELRNTIGEVYRAIGEPEKAVAMFQQALELRRKLFGPEHPDVATTLDDLGGALMEQGKLEEAEQAEREALEMRRKLLGKENGPVALALNNLALVLWSRSKLPEAETMHREALAMRRKVFGEEHSEVANSLNNLAIVLRDRGKLGEAEALHREALAMRRRLLGNDHPDITISLNNLASVLWDENKLGEAEKLERESIELQRKLLGTAHPNLAGALNNLATTLWKEGQYAEAEDFTREALAMRRKLLGPEHPDIALSLNNLGFMLYRQGKLKDAEAIHREALAMRRKLLGNEHLDVAQSLQNLAQVLCDEKKLMEAEPLSREALALRRKALGDAHTLVADSLDLLALILREQSRFTDSEPLTRECLAIREKAIPEDWLTDNTRSRLGADLLGQKSYTDAEPFLVAGYQGLKQHLDKIPAERHVRVKEALERLIQLNEATSHPEQVSEWKKTLAEFEKTEPDHKALDRP
jgi:serine/threonine protein kinase/tetratricopeptide (TPR) repeat protein